MTIVQEATKWNQVEFDKAKRERLRRTYKAAVKKNQEQFIFEGEQYVTRYAKYVLEYLDLKLR